MNFEIKIFNNFDSEIEKIWINFEKDSKNYCFQNFYWLKNWHANLTTKTKIFNILVFQNEKIIMIIPLYTESKNGVRILKWQGGDRADYMGCLLTTNFFIEKKNFIKIWEKIKKEINLFDIVYLQRQPKKILNNINPFFSYLKNYEDYVTNSINLEKDFNLFLSKNVKSKFISDTKRRINGLQKLGELKFEIIDNTNDLEVKSTVKNIFIEKAQRLEKYKLKNPFNEEAKKFYLNFDNQYFKNGYLHISKLTINETTISYHWGVVYKNVFYHLVPTITESEYVKYAPGRIHLQNLIKWATTQNILKFDFTIGNEEYKKDWTNSSEYLHSHIELNSYFYFFHYFFLYLKNIIKKFYLLKNIKKF